MDANRTGSFIAELRQERGMTQRQLADALLVSDKAVSRWETGRGMPDIENLEELARVLDVGIAELLRGERIEGPVEAEEAETVATDGLSLMRGFIRRRTVGNVLAGVLIGAIVLLLAVVHLTSPQAIPYREGLVRIERMDDGTLLAVLDEQVAGYRLEEMRGLEPGDPEPDASDSADGEGDPGALSLFLSCHDTWWNRLTHASSAETGNRGTVVVLGNADSIGSVHYFPGSTDDVLLFGEVDFDGVVTLPRLVYNYWILIGAAASIVGMIAYAALRKRWYARRILRIALIPACFTASIVATLWGSFGEVYDAAFYLSGMCLLALALYGFCLLALELHDSRKPGLTAL